jgi:hypothetical protein
LGKNEYSFWKKQIFSISHSAFFVSNEQNMKRNQCKPITENYLNMRENFIWEFHLDVLLKTTEAAIFEQLPL